MSQGIHESRSLAAFTADPQPVLEQARRHGAPILLTQDGTPGLVVQDAAAYQSVLDRLDELEAIAAVKEGLLDVANGRTRPIREVLAELAAKHKLS